MLIFLRLVIYLINDQFYEKIDNIVSVSEKLYDLLSEKNENLIQNNTIKNPKSYFYYWSLQKLQNLRDFKITKEINC